MNPTKLMAVALCAAACVTTTAFAEDDDLVAPANVKAIADPVNPKLGMVFKGYNEESQYGDKLKELGSFLEKASPVKSTIVDTEQFSFEHFLKDVKIYQGVWEGFLKCKRSAKCTILLQQGGSGYSDPAFILFVNGTLAVSGRGQASIDVNLKAGFNHIKVVAQTKFPVTVSLTPVGSTKEPKPLSPAMMWHDEKPEDDVL